MKTKVKEKMEHMIAKINAVNEKMLQYLKTKDGRVRKNVKLNNNILDRGVTFNGLTNNIVEDKWRYTDGTIFDIEFEGLDALDDGADTAELETDMKALEDDVMILERIIKQQDKVDDAKSGNLEYQSLEYPNRFTKDLVKKLKGAYTDTNTGANVTKIEANIAKRNTDEYNKNIMYMFATQLGLRTDKPDVITLGEYSNLDGKTCPEGYRRICEAQTKGMDGEGNENKNRGMSTYIRNGAYGVERIINVDHNDPEKCEVHWNDQPYEGMKNDMKDINSIFNEDVVTWIKTIISENAETHHIKKGILEKILEDKQYVDDKGELTDAGLEECVSQMNPTEMNRHKVKYNEMLNAKKVKLSTAGAYMKQHVNVLIGGVDVMNVHIPDMGQDALGHADKVLDLLPDVVLQGDCNMNIDNSSKNPTTKNKNMLLWNTNSIGTHTIDYEGSTSSGGNVHDGIIAKQGMDACLEMQGGNWAFGHDELNEKMIVNSDHRSVNVTYNKDKLPPTLQRKPTYDYTTK